MPPKKTRPEPKAKPDVKHVTLPPEPPAKSSGKIFNIAVMAAVAFIAGAAGAGAMDWALAVDNSILKGEVYDAESQLADKKAELEDAAAKVLGETRRADEEAERRRTAQDDRDVVLRTLAVSSEDYRLCQQKEQAFERQDRELTKLSNNISQDNVAFRIFQNSLNFEGKMLRHCEGGE